MQLFAKDTWEKTTELSKQARKPGAFLDCFWERKLKDGPTHLIEQVRVSSWAISICLCLA